MLDQIRVIVLHHQHNHFYCPQIPFYRYKMSSGGWELGSVLTQTSAREVSIQIDS